MVILWYVLVLAPVIAVPLLWWSYQRKQAARERQASERWNSVVQQATKAETKAAATAQPPASAATSGTSASVAYHRRERLLGPAETLAYYLLRSGLTDCEVLVGVRLDQIVTVADASGPSAAGRLNGLSRHTFDFVVCDKAMKALAAVDVLDSEAGAVLTAAPDFKALCLAQAGVRYVRVLRSALPKRQDIRAVVLGPAASD